MIISTKQINPKANKLASHTIIVFFLSLILCLLLIMATIINRSNVEKLQMEQLITEKSIRINEVISKLLYKTEALSALVIQSNGSMENFDRVASTIVDDPSILNVLVAPNGIVSEVYPFKGNESVIGLDFFGEGAGNKEAQAAKETGSLVFGGPFTLKQGGEALVGRLPVYINQANDSEEFWGIVSVTLKYPEALDGVALSLLEAQGFSYEIWRINPEDNEKQIIAQSQLTHSENARFIEKKIEILNAVWYFRVAPVRLWYHYPENWLLIIAGLGISFLIAFVMQNNYDLRIMKNKFEDMAHTDSLTGIPNVRSFMETATRQIAAASNTDQKFYIVIFDIDKFKKINDTYGHLVGDEVLKDITAITKCVLHPKDIFARYGGEEFIILAQAPGQTEIIAHIENVRHHICEHKFLYNSNCIEISASFGITEVLPDTDLTQAIQWADVALYQAKANGRNAVVFN